MLLASLSPLDDSISTTKNHLISRIETISKQWRSTLDEYLACPRWAHSGQTEVYYDEMVYFTGSNSPRLLSVNDSAESSRRNYVPSNFENLG